MRKSEELKRVGPLASGAETNECYLDQGWRGAEVGETRSEAKSGRRERGKKEREVELGLRSRR